jgi:hypothetical protein
MPLGFERRPPKRLGGYGPPIDQVPPVGSPVKPIAMADRAAANSGPKLYAAPRPSTAEIY